MPASIFQGTAVKILKNVLKFADGTTLSSTVAGYLANITSDVQDQIDNLSAPSFTYTAETAGATLAVGEYAVMSGASGDVTLPTAVGQAGKSIIIEHGGTSLTQKYTVQTTSSQTVGGVAGGSYVICTAGEVLHVVSDNANWRIANHKTNTEETSYTPSFGAGMGTCTSLSFAWWREGKFMCIRGTGVAGTVTSAEASFSLPTGASLGGAGLGATQTHLFGDYYYSNASSAQLPGLQGPLPIIHSTADSTKLYLCESVDTDETFFRDELANAVIATGWTFSFNRVRIPISDWQP